MIRCRAWCGRPSRPGSWPVRCPRWVTGSRTARLRGCFETWGFSLHGNAKVEGVNERTRTPRVRGAQRHRRRTPRGRAARALGQHQEGRTGRNSRTGPRHRATRALRPRHRPRPHRHHVHPGYALGDVEPLSITRQEFHGECNYTLHPTTRRDPPRMPIGQPLATDNPDSDSLLKTSTCCPLPDGSDRWPRCAPSGTVSGGPAARRRMRAGRLVTD